MKSLIRTLLFTLITALAAAQSPTDNDFGIGGQGGPMMRYTTVLGKSAIMLGNQSGVVFNRRFVFGGSGFSLLKTFDTDTPISLGYGGGTFEYMGTIGESVFYNAGIMMGGGGMQVGTESGGLFVSEISAAISIETLPLLRIGVAAGYRLAVGTPVNGHSATAFSGPSAGINFSIGSL